VLITFVWLVLGLSVHAQLRPAPGAPSNQRPSIRSSSSGTPVVNITKPDKNGVSTNQFDAFNVDKRGLIFNNNFLPGHSRLGGVVKHNPNFAWGDFARLIIDEVVGASPSAIEGIVEVFGPRAALLIANPNGVTANGAEFHNVSRLTLAAGSVQYDRHGNVGLSIDTGNLEIGSGGLHVVTIDDVTVLGRNIILDGPVESGYLLSLFAGKRYFDYNTRTSTGTGARGKGKWGIDSSALGGMSAGRIVMESTDKGVGVRAPRHMAASAGDITITADGRIHLDHLRSNGRIIVRSASGNIVQRGNVVAVVVVIALTVVSYGWFAPVGSTILGALTGAGSTAFATGLSAAAAVAVGAAVVGGGIGFTGAFLSTVIATGNFGTAFQAGLIGLAVGFVAGGLVKVPVINGVFGTVGNAIKPVFLFVSDAGKIATNLVSQLVTKAVSDALTTVLDKVVYAQGGAAFGSQFFLGLGLFALTAFAAAEIGHFSALESFWKTGPSIDVAGQPITLTEEFIKPELQGLAAYGIGEGLGIKDPEALGVGAAAGSFVAPWVMAASNAYFGLSPDSSLTVYQLASPAYASSVAPSVGSQITGLIGGLASYAYDGDFSIGQFGATQVYNFNDSAGLKRKQNPDGAWNVYDLSNGNDPYLVATSDSPDAAGRLTFLSSEYTRSGVFWDGETLGGFIKQIRAEGSFAAMAGGADIPSFEGSTISTEGQNEIIPGGWDLTKYHSQFGFPSGLADNGTIITAPDGSTSTRYIADAAIDQQARTFENAAVYGGALALGGTLGWAAQTADSTTIQPVQELPTSPQVATPAQPEFNPSDPALNPEQLSWDVSNAAEETTLNFSQTTASPWFSKGSPFNGSTISDVAGQLRAGTLSAADLPIQTVTMDGNTLIVNTRSALALSQAGIPQSAWSLVDMTGNSEVMSSIATRLGNNGLTTAGTPVLRITGSGSGASTYFGAGTIPRP
jgi:filamentous hemagglutinin family protein